MILHKENIAKGIIFLSVLYYIWVVLHYASFMPISDDYGAILSFLNHYANVNDYGERCKILLEQYGEHRIVFNRIVELLQWYISGEVNFIYLIIIGNIGWLFLVWLMWSYAHRTLKLSVFSFTPVALIMLSFTHSALMTWAMASLQQYWQLYFSLLSIYFLVNSQVYKTLIVMTIAIFTGGGGIVLTVVILLYYFMHKEWKNGIIAFVIVMSIFLVYFVLLDFHRHARDLSALYIIFNQFKMLVSYVIVFLGNIGYYEYLAFYVGVFFLALFVFASKKIYKDTPFIFWSILFIVITAGIVGLSRSGLGLTQALSSRYAIYSTLFLALLYLGYLKIVVNKKYVIFLGYAVGSILFIIYINIKIPAFEERKIVAETKLDFTEGFAEPILLKSEKHSVFSAFRKIMLPSEIVKVSYEKRAFQYNILLNDSALLTQENQNNDIRIRLLPSSINLSVSGWGKAITSSEHSCGLIWSLENKTSVLYANKKVMRGNQKHYLFNGNIRVDGIRFGTSILELKLLNKECKSYGKSLKLHLHKEKLEKYLSLPIQFLHLRGWIESFEKNNDSITVIGWYGLPNLPSKSKMLLLEIDGKKYLTRYGYSRPDVVDALKNNAYIKSGFKLTLPMNNLTIGKHKVKVYLLSDDLSVWYSDDKIYYFVI